MASFPVITLFIAHLVPLSVRGRWGFICHTPQRDPCLPRGSDHPWSRACNFSHNYIQTSIFVKQIFRKATMKSLTSDPGVQTPGIRLCLKESRIKEQFSIVRNLGVLPSRSAFCRLTSEVYCLLSESQGFISQGGILFSKQHSSSRTS